MYLFDNEVRAVCANILPVVVRLVPRRMVCFICRHLMQQVITINLEEGE